MSWFKVDDTLHSHEKPKRMRRSIRNEAMGLWTFLGSWAAQHETDGFVPEHIVDDFGGTPEIIDALVEAELWDRESNGVTFRNWSSYQPLRAEKDEERAKTAERVRRYRERQKGKKTAPTSKASNGVTSSGVTDLYARPDPTRPDPVTTPLPPEGELLATPEPPKPKAFVYPDAFERFWAAWPKPGDNKRPAFTAWEKATKGTSRKPPRITVEDLQAAVERYAADPGLPDPKTEARFIPAASSWINQDRWENGPLPPRGPAAGRPTAGDTHRAMQRSHEAANTYRVLEESGYYQEMRRTA